MKVGKEGEETGDVKPKRLSSLFKVTSQWYHTIPYKIGARPAVTLVWWWYGGMVPGTIPYHTSVWLLAVIAIIFQDSNPGFAVQADLLTLSVS
jgi:hypothetical protein